MDFYCKIDDIHNPHAAIYLNGKTSTPAKTNHPLITWEEGDAMDIYATDIRGRSGIWGGEYRGGMRSWRDWRNRVRRSDSGRSGISGQEAEEEEGEKPTSPKAGGGKTWSWVEGCFHCYSLDNMKKDSLGHQKLLESYVRRDT